jgi:hypothetical protein
MVAMPAENGMCGFDSRRDHKLFLSSKRSAVEKWAWVWLLGIIAVPFLVTAVAQWANKEK